MSETRYEDADERKRREQEADAYLDWLSGRGSTVVTGPKDDDRVTSDELSPEERRARTEADAKWLGIDAREPRAPESDPYVLRTPDRDVDFTGRDFGRRRERGERR